MWHCILPCMKSTLWEAKARYQLCMHKLHCFSSLSLSLLLWAGCHLWCYHSIDPGQMFTHLGSGCSVPDSLVLQFQDIVIQGERGNWIKQITWVMRFYRDDDLHYYLHWYTSLLTIRHLAMFKPLIEQRRCCSTLIHIKIYVR